ncbi:Na+/glutamate symporter [Skermanella aerolata]|uniref:hypothetical protein n=1 Tax=Skermanella aerolata TaxID=393310 RepID=UPI003D22BFB5
MAILLSLATGPLMILGILLAIPLALVLMVLSAVMVVFFLWALIWALVWLMGDDPDAPRNFLQALGISCAAAATMTSLGWGMSSFKDWLVSRSSRTDKPVSVRDQQVASEPDEGVIQPMPVPANDWTPQRGR